MSEHKCGLGCSDHSLQEHAGEVQEEFHEARRTSLKNVVVAGGAAMSVGSPGITHTSSVFAQDAVEGSRRANHYHVPASDKTVHWGYFSRLL